MEDKKIKVIKTNMLIPGVCSSAKFIGKELQEKLNNGEVIEVNFEQLDQMKHYGWVEIYKEINNVKGSKTEKGGNPSAN